LVLLYGKITTPKLNPYSAFSACAFISFPNSQRDFPKTQFGSLEPHSLLRTDFIIFA
jgi:hypothetical protein